MDDDKPDVFPWVACRECGQAVVDMPTHLRFHRVTHVQADSDAERKARARRLGCVLIGLFVIGAFLIGAFIARSIA
jgi:hypothetical protein